MEQGATPAQQPSASQARQQAPDKHRVERPRAVQPRVAPGRGPLPPRPMMLQALEAAGMTTDLPPDPQNPFPGDAGRAQSSELLDPVAIAQAGTAGPGGALPFGDRIQAAFGRHDLRGVEAFVGGAAKDAADQLGATAFAHGRSVGFAGSPDLHTAAHEAAHVVQQRAGVHLAGGIGAVGDAYEQHADAVADAVVNGGPAEALLDAFVGSSSGGGGPAVQRERQAQVEARQPWERYRLDSPVAAEDTAITAAQQANIALGFEGRAIDRMLQRLDFTRSHRRGTFTREATEALATFQGEHGLSGGPIADEGPTEEAAGGGAGGREAIRGGATPTAGAADTGAAGSEQVSGTGVLDEATVMALDVGAAVRGLHNRARRHYRNSRTWRGLSGEAFEAIRAVLIRRLGVTEADLTQETVGRGRRQRTRVAVSDPFAYRVYGWQLWRSRGQAADGLLDEADLRALGALPEEEATPTPEADAAPADQREAAQAEEQAAAEEGAATDEEGPTEAEGQPDDPAEETVADPPQTETTPQPGGTHRHKMELMLQHVRGYLSEVQIARRITPREARIARRAALARPMESRMRAYREQLDAWGVEGLDTNLLDRPRNMVTRNWARRWVRVLDAFLDGRTPQPAAGGGRVPRGTLPVGRPMGATQGADVGAQTIEEARAFLTERNLIVRDERIVADGWDPRLQRSGGPTRPVNEIANEAVAGLTSLKTRMERGQHDLESAIDRADDPDRNHLRRVYFEVVNRDYTPPRTVRNRWRVNLPRTPSAERIAGWNRSQVLSHARQLRSGLRREARRLVAEIRRNTNYQGRIHMENPHGVVVNLHRSGVDVCWGQGTPMNVDLFHLDPVFAVAMFRYLEVLRGLGVTKLWTSGFLRPHGTAISVLDSHPRGMACDITGFQFGETLIHLRGGFPMEPTNARYDHWQRGHSDWFDERGTLNGRTHREIMLGMAEILPRYFGRIIGPGHNASHMNHFHVETYGNPRAGPSLRAISEYADMPEWTHARADRLDPSWRTGGRPPENLTDPE